jgi:hypothetical protein
MTKVTQSKLVARGKLGDHDIEAVCVNPGDWFGKVWLIEVGLGYSSSFYAVEAGNEQDAIDTLADSEEFGHTINVDDRELAEAPAVNGDDEENGWKAYDRWVESHDYSTAGNDSHLVDLTNVAIHGKPCTNMDRNIPWPCLYFAPEGINPLDFA